VSVRERGVYRRDGKGEEEFLALTPLKKPCFQLEMGGLNGLDVS